MFVFSSKLKQWEVVYDKRSNYYTIKNKKSGAYLSGDSSRAGFNASISSASSEKPVTWTTPVFWDIRQSDYEGCYAYVFKSFNSIGILKLVMCTWT